MAKKRKGALPSGNVRVQVYVGTRADGTRRYESFTAPTRPQAQAAALAYRMRLRTWLANEIPVDQIPGPEDDAPAGQQTLRQLLAIHLETCRLQQLSPATLRMYACIARRSFPSLLPVPVAKLNAAMIQDAVNARVREGRSPKTIRNELAFLHAALQQARPDLQMHAVRVPVRRLKEMTIPSTDDLRRILRAAEGMPIYIPVCLAALMGLRRSEICGLTWEDVDLKQKTLRIHQAMVRSELGTYSIKGTKTSAGERTLPIPSALVPVLAAARNIDPRVTQLTPAAITCRYERLMAELSMSYRFHDLRHYHASTMIAVGAPEKYITADMGHSSMDMVRRVYGHVMEERQAIINEGMDASAASLLS